MVDEKKNAFSCQFPMVFPLVWSKEAFGEFIGFFLNFLRPKSHGESGRNRKKCPKMCGFGAMAAIKSTNQRARTIGASIF